MNNEEMNKKIQKKVQTKLAISNFQESEENTVPKNKILKMVATFILAIVIVGGVTYGGIKIVEIFRIKGMDDAGIQTAIQNNYIQNIDMDYVEEEKVKFKVDYFMMDDLNFDLVFNFVTEERVENYEGIALTNLRITDENNNQIYFDSEDQDIWTKNIALMTSDWSVIEKQGNTLRQVLHLTSNNFPKSNKIYVSFDKVTLYNVNQGDPITIEYDGDYKLDFDVSEQLSERKTIEYTTIEESKIVGNAKLTNSGFAITINSDEYISPKDNITVTDENGNTYTLSNTLRIFGGEYLDKIEKQILIFNMTLYNECNIIKLNLENGATYELINKDSIKTIRVDYNASEKLEGKYHNVYFVNDTIKNIEDCTVYKTEKEAKEEFEEVPDTVGDTLNGKTVSLIVSLADGDNTSINEYMQTLEEQKKEGIVKNYYILEE